MRTREQQITSGGLDGYANFIGDDTDYRDWLGFIGRHRDSDALENSNFEAALEAIGGEGANVRVERYGHWAVGWIEEVYVRPGTFEADRAEEIREALADYPVVDEEDFSRRESEEANRVWSDCYSESDRIKYIRRNRSQFDFDSLADLRACVRGEFFNGYASELIS